MGENFADYLVKVDSKKNAERSAAAGWKASFDSLGKALLGKGSGKGTGGRG